MNYTMTVVIYFGESTLMLDYEQCTFNNKEPFVMGVHCLIEYMRKETSQ